MFDIKIEKKVFQKNEKNKTKIIRKKKMTNTEFQ